MKGRVVSRTEYVTPKTEQTRTSAETSSCDTMVRAENSVAQQDNADINTETEQPITVTIHMINGRAKSSRVGRHTRKTKGKVYSSPRILLRPNLDNHVGKRALVFQARASITGHLWNLEDKDVLIVVLLP